MIALGSGKAEAKRPPCEAPNATLLVTGLEGASGSTLGPVVRCTSPKARPAGSRASIRRPGISRRSPAVCRPSIIGFGGAIDVAFIGKTAYVLVTLVGPDLGGSDVVGIYRVDGPDSFTVVADIGEFSLDNPPGSPFFVPTGVQYALETYRGGFLVTDGHHNRVLQVTLDGEVTEVITFGNIVPTGLAVRGNTVYMAEAGPVPHLPADGKVVSFGPNSLTATEVASGAPLLVDVEFGRGRTLYALSQGDWSGDPEGSPALPDTGALMRVNGDGTLTVVVGRAGPADLARVHREHRLRRHPHRGDLEDRGRLASALRCVALSNRGPDACRFAVRQ